MYNQTAFSMGDNRCAIRDLAEYGAARSQIIGKENVFDFTIGNPSLPAPPQIAEAIRDILENMDVLASHSYTSAAGDMAATARRSLTVCGMPALKWLSRTAHFTCL